MLRFAVIGLLVIGGRVGAKEVATRPTVDPVVQACEAHAKNLVTVIFEPNKQLYTDLDKDTQWLYHGRLDALLKSVDKGQFDEVFAKMTAEDLEELFQLANSGYLQINGRPLTEKELLFLMDLHELNSDSPGIFWKNKKERLAHVLLKLEEINKRNDSATGWSVTGELTSKAVGNTEKNLMTRAVNPDKKKYKSHSSFLGIPMDGLKRFFMPLYPRVQKILEFNNFIRKQFQHAAEIDGVVDRVALSQKAELGLTGEDENAFGSLIAQTAGETAQARADLKEAYGDELSYKKGMEPEELDPYAVYGKVKHFDSSESTVDYQRRGETKLDRMNERLDAVRKRKNQKARTEADWDQKEVRIRHMERERKTGETRRAHHSALAREANMTYTVYYEWTETHTRQVYTGTDSKGNAQYRTEIYTTHHTGSVDRHPSYWEILKNEYDTSPPRGSTTSVSGLKEISRATEKLREQEVPLWFPLEKSEDNVLELINQHADTLKGGDAKVAEVKKLLASEKEQLERVLRFMHNYVETSESNIHQQFKYDDVSDFRRRNMTLTTRYENLIRYIRVYDEQLNRRDPILRLQYETPTYTAEMKELERRMNRNFWIKLGGSVFMGAGAGGGGYWYYLEQEEEEKRKKEEERKRQEEKWRLRDIERRRMWEREWDDR